jgi:Transglutaminase-like enzymes, putative cysteine proteases
MKRIFLSVYFLGFLSFFAFNSCSHEKEKSYRVVETYRIKSSNESKSRLSVDLPISYGYQTISEINIKNADESFFEERDGYKTLHVNVKGSSEEEEISIEYFVTLLNDKCNWKGDPEEKHLIPGEFIDSDDKNIIDLAGTLKADGNDFKTAENISRYVTKNIKFDRSPKMNGRTPLASEVLESKKGVCRDYANLMTALLRASGIPAKNISGLSLKNLKRSSDWSSSGGSHAWVEFCIGKEWYFADPSWGHRYFTHSDGYHLSYGSQPVNLDSQAYQENLNKDENKERALIASMTAPIRFTVWSEDNKASVTPKVSITVSNKKE